MASKKSDKKGESGRRASKSVAKGSQRQKHGQAHAHRTAHVAKASGGGHEKAASQSGHRWSHEVMQHSDALDLESDIFKNASAQKVADSLKESSLKSHRRRGTPFQSAMSMLNFYINRAGRNLPKTRRDTLQRAKQKLREAFGRA